MSTTPRALSLALLFLAVITTALPSHAGIAPRPESLRLVAYHDIGDDRYREIEVSCSNRSEASVYKRENQREWCVGGPGAGECFKQNMDAAKRACAATDSNRLADR